MKQTSTALGRLEVPTVGASMALVKTFVRGLAQAVGFDAQEKLNAIELAAEEAFALVLERAVPGAEAHASVRGALSPVALELEFDDKELPPLDLGTEASRAPLVDTPLLDAEHLGRTLIRHAADEASWIPLGKDGNRLKLTFRLAHTPIQHTLNAEALEQFDEGAALAPEQDYSIRLAGTSPDDWAKIARAMYRAYGFTYLADDFYMPSHIEAMNTSGRVVSIVAVAEDGEIVGHYALDHARFMSSDVSEGQTAELGKAVVDPRHRGRGLMERMRAMAEARAQSSGLAGVFSEPVTMHPYSQRANLKLGAVPTALNLGMVSNAMKLKAIDEQGTEGRQSTFIFFKLLTTPAPREVFAPAVHADRLAATYKDLQVEVCFATPDGAVARPALTELEVHYVAAVDIGVVSVHQIGEDCHGPLKVARDELIRRVGTRVIYLDIPLSDPGCPELAAAAESLGFFYGGLGPFFDTRGDVLRMQLVDVLVAIDQHAVTEGAAKTLFDYVLADRARVDALQAGS